jgi:hypothetical protein
MNNESLLFIPSIPSIPSIMDSEDSLIIKKKRGRKPKNRDINQQIESNLIQNTEKKKRGRKKKYEIENFNRIVNRDLPNNFNHKIAYSDDEEYEQIKDLSIRNTQNIPQILPCIQGSTANSGNSGNKQVKNISFGKKYINTFIQINYFKY